MNCNKYLDIIFDRVSALEDDFKVVKAYPNAYKPTRIDMTTVAISPADEVVESVGLGGYGVKSDNTIKITVISQYKKGIDELCRVVDIVTSGIASSGALSLSVGSADASKSMDAISVDIIVKYSDFLEISYGE